MENFCAGSVRFPTAVSCRRLRSRGRALVPPTLHPWMRKTTTPDRTIIITITNTDTAVLTTSMSSVVSPLFSHVLSPGCSVSPSSLKKHTNVLCVCHMLQAEWEPESWTGAGTVEAEVKLPSYLRLLLSFYSQSEHFLFHLLCSHKSSSIQKETPKKKPKLEMKPSNGDRYDRCSTLCAILWLHMFSFMPFPLLASCSFPSPSSSSITQSMDSGGTDNFILISQLKEEVMSLKRLLQQRDQTILEKDRKVG